MFGDIVQDGVDLSRQVRQLGHRGLSRELVDADTQPVGALGTAQRIGTAGFDLGPDRAQDGDGGLQQGDLLGREVRRLGEQRQDGGGQGVGERAGQRVRGACLAGLDGGGLTRALDQRTDRPAQDAIDLVGCVQCPLRQIGGALRLRRQ